MKKDRQLMPAMSFCPAGKDYDHEKAMESLGVSPLSLEAESYYLQEYSGYVHNQSEYYTDSNDNEFWVGANSCVADAFTAILEKIEYHKGGKILPSVSWVYGKSGNSSGMYNADAYSSLRNEGVIPYQYLGQPYYMDKYSDALSISDFTRNGVVYKGAKNTYNGIRSQQLTNASKTKLSSFSEYRVYGAIETGLEGQMQRAIKSKNRGVLINYLIDDSFDDLDYDGILKNSNYTGSNRGYHASTVVGWITIEGVLHWIVQNSWATDWANGGFCYMPSNWRGLEWVGLVTGTDNPPAVFSDIPLAPTQVGDDITWNPIVGATEYEVRVNRQGTCNTFKSSTNKYSISFVFFNTATIQIQYRAILPQGFSMWSNSLNIVHIGDDIVKASLTTSHSMPNRWSINIDKDQYTSTSIKLVDMRGNNVEYGVSSTSPYDEYINTPIPLDGEYYDLTVTAFTRYAGREKTTSTSMRLYGNLKWTYMSESSGKEVMITALEWNNMQEWLKALSKAINYYTKSKLTTVNKNDVFSALHYNEVVDFLKIDFIKGANKHIDTTLIPPKVTIGMPVTKEPFLNLLKAVNSIRLKKY